MIEKCFFCNCRLTCIYSNRRQKKINHSITLKIVKGFTVNTDNSGDCSAHDDGRMAIYRTVWPLSSPPPKLQGLVPSMYHT